MAMDGCGLSVRGLLCICARWLWDEPGPAVTVDHTFTSRPLKSEVEHTHTHTYLHLKPQTAVTQCRTMNRQQA